MDCVPSKLEADKPGARGQYSSKPRPKSLKELSMINYMPT